MALFVRLGVPYTAAFIWFYALTIRTVAATITPVKVSGAFWIPPAASGVPTVAIRRITHDKVSVLFQDVILGTVYP